LQPQEQKASSFARALLACKELPKGPQDTKDLKVTKDLKDLKVLKVLKALKKKLHKKQ